MKLSRIAVALLVTIGITAGAARAATEIKDVDPSNWAYKSIKKLVDKGYLAIYEDNTFRGDQSVSRTVFAAALAKLIDQIERGELKLGGSELNEIKKLSDEFKSEISDYDSKMGALEKRVSDIESGKVVIQTDISKTTVEFRDKFDKMSAQMSKMNEQIGYLRDDLNKMRVDLENEKSSRKKAQTMLWVGVVVAAVAGAASN